MKSYKKAILALLTGISVIALSGCSMDLKNNDIATIINNSVTMPEQYSITYEIENAAGEIWTIQKTKDSEGNVYFESAYEELLFIKEDEHYTLYKKDVDGNFTIQGINAVYNETYVDTATDEFLAYAERSKQQFLPGMESTGEQEVNGRICLVYGVKLGSVDTSITYTFFVDKETGICMGWDETNKVSGHEIDGNGEIFSCTEFITEDVPSLKELINK